MEKTVKTTKSVKATNTIKKEGIDMKKMETIVYTAKGLSVEIPKNNIYMGVDYAGAFDEEFTFAGNKQQGRQGLTRTISFTTAITEEVTSINEKAINEKYKAIALFKTVERGGVEKQQCINVSIVSLDGKKWVLANGTPNGAIDIIGKILQVKSWSTAHNFYKELVGRKTQSNKQVKVEKKESAFEL